MEAGGDEKHVYFLLGLTTTKYEQLNCRTQCKVPDRSIHSYVPYFAFR